jgi:hypothetical protein
MNLDPESDMTAEIVIEPKEAFKMPPITGILAESEK